MKNTSTLRVDTTNTLCDYRLKPAMKDAGQQQELRRSLATPLAGSPPAQIQRQR
jgi:hypothetical protein